MVKQPRLTPIPKTQLTFVNVPLVPVRTRAGETRYLCATWGGAMHLFDRYGAEKVIAYPEGGLGSYSFVPAVADGFAWAVITGGKIVKIDVDTGEVVLCQDVPLEKLNWGACITRDGYLVANASNGSFEGGILVYDTNREQVRKMITPISLKNNYGHNVRTAPDDAVIIPLASPGAELIRLDPRTCEYESFQPEATRDLHIFTKSVTVLPDGRFAIPRESRVDTVTYPDFSDAAPLAYPEERDTGWDAFRDYGDGRLFAYPKGGGQLYALNDACEWERYLDHFAPRQGWQATKMFCALPERRLLGLSIFGELVEYQHDGTETPKGQLNNYGYQRFCDLEPGEGSQVFTASFINMSFQELDYRTGEGRNIRPCQEYGGQVNHIIWFRDKVWLACYAGAEITCYDPKAGGRWPENPRPVAQIGHHQKRPVGFCCDGKCLWCCTKTGYGQSGGALSRLDPDTEDLKVWRDLVPDHNPGNMIMDGQRRTLYIGTTLRADSGSAPPATNGPAAVIAFDVDREETAWVARPAPEAETLQVDAVYQDALMVRLAVTGGYRVFLLDPATGATRRTFPLAWPEEWTGTRVEFFTGPDGRLYAASDADFLFL